MADWMMRILERMIQQVVQWASSFMDAVRFWRTLSVTSDIKDKFDGHGVPVLMFPNNDDSWSLYDIADDKILKSCLPPPPYDCAFTGSSQGWLGTFTTGFELELYKAFDENKTTLRLPPLFPPESKRLHEAQAQKWWLSKFVTFTPDSIMNPTDFICVAIFGEKNQIAYIRPSRDEKWNLVEACSRCDATVSEVLFYNNQLYAVSFTSLISYDLLGTSKPRTQVVSKGPDLYLDGDDYPCKDYLVESPDKKLLYVQRYMLKNKKITTKFVVWKLAFDGTTPRWEQLESLGKCALFIGESTSISVSTLSDNNRCMKNCIYFTDDKYVFCFGENHKPYDLGVYNLETKGMSRGFGIEKTIFTNIGEGRFPIFIDRRN